MSKRTSKKLTQNKIAQFEFLRKTGQTDSFRTIDPINHNPTSDSFMGKVAGLRYDESNCLIDVSIATASRFKPEGIIVSPKLTDFSLDCIEVIPNESRR